MKREDGTAELVPGGHREAVERVAALVKERLLGQRPGPALQPHRLRADQRRRAPARRRDPRRRGASWARSGRTG